MEDPIGGIIPLKGGTPLPSLFNICQSIPGKVFCVLHIIVYVVCTLYSIERKGKVLS